MSKNWDFFISYASEDRADAADPIELELTKRGFAVWLDHKTLDAPKELEAQIQRGLSECHFGVVILSPRFLEKDWPMREIDTLFAIESIEGRRRVVPLLHKITASELEARVPDLRVTHPILTREGAVRVCDQILERVLQSTDRSRQEQLGEFGTDELPRFSAPGQLKCVNSECSWRPPADWPDFLHASGPEFTFAKVGEQWCIVCAECRSPVGSITEDEAKQLAGQIRMSNLWARDRKEKGDR
ncbi:MAG: toll/interleukin-1 receptor domain-containing protein [Bryobacteraceae bacterium]